MRVMQQGFCNESLLAYGWFVKRHLDVLFVIIHSFYASLGFHLCFTCKYKNLL